MTYEHDAGEFRTGPTEDDMLHGLARNLGAKDGDWVLFQRDERTFYFRLGEGSASHGECSGSEQFVGALTLIRQDAKFRCDSGSVWLLDKTTGALVLIEVLVHESESEGDAGPCPEHAGQILGGAK